MKNIKLIFINLSVGAFFFGGLFSILLAYDFFFPRKYNSVALKKSEFTNLNEIYKESDFPTKNSIHYYPDYGFNFFGLDKKIFPINGRSNIRTFYCEEQGYLSEYNSDRHGFRNPDSILDSKNIDIALVGDSFIDGACTNEFTFRNNLTKLSNDKLKIANFSLGGSGPLLQLAYMKEFGKFYKPKKVFWFWALNDLRNLQDELQSPVRQYMVKDFSQGLYKNENKIIADKVVEQYLNWVKKEKNKQGSLSLYDRKVAISMRFARTYKVYKTIKRFIPQIYFDTPAYWDSTTVMTRNKILTRRIPPEEYKLMDDVVFEVMNEVDKLVKSWGGEITLIYIGRGGFNSKPNPPKVYFGQHSFQKELVKKIALKNNFKFFDLDKEIDNVFKPIDHVKGFSRGRGHFTDEGYQKVSKIIYENLLKN